MQFFEHQDQARGRTTLLVVLFILAILLMAGLSSLGTHCFQILGDLPGEPLSPNHWIHVFGAGLITLIIILFGSLYRMGQLRDGGVKVAETLGGTLVSTNSTDFLQRRALNIVEEMAIAAGLPVPPVYVMQRESGINAFAAGWTPDDAVIGLTQGALENLNRDQLQGVIAHEFSHILNRDCALNLRLMGVLHGIVIISVIGRIMMQFGVPSANSRRQNNSQLHFIIAGGLIWLFGSLGIVAARVIQAAVARQREFLADASAVQFTRNPEGIAGALATIGSQSSALSTPRGGETSHLLIGDPGRTHFLGSLASHPPLFERIHRVLPAWDGNFAALATPAGSVRKALENQASLLPSEELNPLGVLTGSPLSAEGSLMGAFEKETSVALPAGSVEANLVGALILEPVASVRSPGSSVENKTPTTPPAAILHEAGSLLASLPHSLHEAAEDPFSSRALILAWVLDEKPGERNAQMALLGGDPALAAETARLYHLIDKIDPRCRLPLFDIALGTLASLSERQKEDFADHLATISAQLSAGAYRSYCLAVLARRHLVSTGTRRKSQKALIKDAIETVLGILAVQGHDTHEEALSAFQAGTKQLGKRGELLRFAHPSTLTIQSFEAAFATLERLPTATRMQILNAAEFIAAFDGVLKPGEAELLRAIATCIGVATKPATPPAPTYFA